MPKGRRVPGIKSQLVVPTPLRHEILIGGHDDPLAGHLGVNKTYEKLRERYYWPKMFADVQFWCLSCTHCQMKKSPKQRQTAPVLPIPVEGAFDRVAVDCLGPFPVSNSGNRYIVVFSDYLTRYPEAFAVPSIDAPTIADLLVNEILPRHGAPRTLLSDRGSNFLSSLVREVCFLMDTKKTYTTSYHPQCDGLVERFNGTLAQSLSHYVSSNQKDWDRYLNPVLFGYRISPSEVTGESPFFLLYGRQPRLPMDVSMLPPRDISASIADHRARVVENIEIAQRIAKENIQRAQQRMKDYHDLHAVPVRFQVGDNVWVYTPRNRKGLSKKLAHNWHGPYRIVQFLSPVHCILRALDNRRVSTTVHVSRLKHYFSPDTRPIRQPTELVDDAYLQEGDLPADSFLQPDVEVPASDPEETANDTAEPETCNIQPTVPTETPAQHAPLTRSRATELRAQASADSTDASHTDPILQTSAGNDIYTVEKLLKQRTKNGQQQFLVKWRGFPMSQNSWEPVTNILDKRLIEKFYQDHPLARRPDDPDYQPQVATLIIGDASNRAPIVAALFYDESEPVSLLKPASDTSSHHGSNDETFEPALHEVPSPSQPPGEVWTRTSLSVQSQYQVSFSEESSTTYLRSCHVPVTQRPSSGTGAESSTVSPLPGNFPARVIRRPGNTTMWLFLFFLLLVFLNSVFAQEYDESGKRITFYPDSLMLATNPRPLIFFNDTKLVSIHTELKTLPRRGQPKLNISCDPAQAAFYSKILASISSIQRTTHRLYSMQGVTSLLECDSFLRRFYQYSTGIPSRMFCPMRHYANNLQECKSWARTNCRVTAPDELAWLRVRQRRSPFICHMGVFGVFRALYHLVTRKSCDQPQRPDLFNVLRESADAMSVNQQLTRVVNGKVTYLVKTTDLLSTKVKQLIGSMRDMDRSFTTWNRQIRTQFKKEQCHYQANMEFLSLYSLQVNRAMSSMLRLNEIEDILHQLSHLTRKTLISFADLPRFLTMELNVRLAAIPSLAHTLDALKSGFSTIIQPLVDYEFQQHKKMQLNLLFTLPEISSSKSLCTVEQLRPITYKHKGYCFGGPVSFDDLLLLTCDTQRFLLKAPELEKCYQDDITILCPENILHTVQQPTWLGLPWTPTSKVAFRRFHKLRSHCRHTPLMLLLGGRYFLSTGSHNLTLYSPGYTQHLSLSPLSIIHVPCNTSFQYQKGGLGTCPSTLRYSLPVFQNNHFTYVPWLSTPASNINLSAPNFPVPSDFTLDNTTLVSLDHTYNLLDHSLTQRLTKLRKDISHLQTASTTTMNDIFTYLTFALTILNCFVLLIFVRRLRPPLQLPTISLSTRDTTTDD